MRIVITGITGFLGRHLARHLCAAGHEVAGIARKDPIPPLPDGVRFVRGDIADTQVTGPLLAWAETLVHLAWSGTPGSSQGRPADEVAGNLVPTALLIGALHAHPHCRVLFVSTGGALHAGDGTPAREDAPLHPRSYYGAAKGAVELLLHALCRQAGHRAMAIRPSNVYGPGQPALPGFGVIPALMRSAREGLDFEVWGDGNTARDFLYISDFSDAIERALSAELPKGHLQIVNAGSGVAVSLNTLHTLLTRISGRDIPRQNHAARTVDPPQVLLDCSRARQSLGWTPAVGIEEGLRLTWDWWKEQP